MPEKKHNHFVPRCLLRSWLCEDGSCKDGPRSHIHVFLTKEQKKEASTSQGKKGYSFAILNDLYIVKSNSGERKTNLEDWFSGLEGELAEVARKLTNRDRPFQDSEQKTKALMAIFGLLSRSRYVLQFIEKRIEDSPDLKSRMCIEKRDITTKQIALENLINFTTEIALRHQSDGIDVLYAPKIIDFVLPDRPVIDMGQMDTTLVILTNKICLMFSKKETGIRTKDIDEKFVNTINELAVKWARDWLVAKSGTVLDQYIPMLTPESISERAGRMDQLMELKPELSKIGWKIPT